MGIDDKAYYLKNIELALLLSIKGVKTLYGFKMNNIQNPDPKLIYQTLFELEKKNIVSFQDKENITIYSGLNQILDNIKNAEKMLLYIDIRAEHPDQCIYLGDRAVFISTYGAMQNMNRIESISIDSLAEVIYERGFCLEEILSDQILFNEKEIMNPDLTEKADVLFGKEFGGLEEDEWKIMTDCLRIYSLKDNKCIKQYLLIKDKLNDYFSVTDEKGSSIFAYSKKTLIDTLRNNLSNKFKDTGDVLL